ncbi:MAG: SnoaL-like domain-containing protein [Nonomuraea sp.]|nr:SnoaL-like domain-containing protein [Nonomuraea sp.]
MNDETALRNKEIALHIWGRDLGKEVDPEGEEFAEHFRTYYTEDYWNHASAPGEDRGFENAKLVRKSFQLLFTDAKFDIELAVADGDLVMLKGLFTAYNTGGSLFGIPADGRFVSQPHVHILRFRDFKVAEHFVVRDDFPMWQQMTSDTREAGITAFYKESKAAEQ